MFSRLCWLKNDQFVIDIQLTTNYVWVKKSICDLFKNLAEHYVILCCCFFLKEIELETLLLNLLSTITTTVDIRKIIFTNLSIKTRLEKRLDSLEKNSLRLGLSSYINILIVNNKIVKTNFKVIQYKLDCSFFTYSW